MTEERTGVRYVNRVPSLVLSGTLGNAMVLNQSRYDVLLGFTPDLYQYEKVPPFAMVLVGADVLQLYGMTAPANWSESRLFFAVMDMEEVPDPTAIYSRMNGAWVQALPKG